MCLHKNADASISHPILIQAIEHRTCAKKVPVSIHIHFCGTVGIAHNALGFTVQRTPFSAAITGHSDRENICAQLRLL